MYAYEKHRHLKRFIFVIALYISIIPLVGAGAFAFGYCYSMGVELYYFNNPVDGNAEQISDFSEPEDAEYLL